MEVFAPQERAGPQRPNRPGQPCPFNCDGGHAYKPLLNHFVKVHLAYTDDELAGDGSRKKCRYCHLTLRASVLDIHAFLQHGVKLPEDLEERLDAVAAGEWGPESVSPIANPTPSADEIAAEFAEYWDPDYSPRADVDEEEGAMSPMTEGEETDAESESEEDEELTEDEQKWLLVRDYLGRPDIWREDKTASRDTWRTELPIYPGSVKELEHWSLAWAMDTLANKGTRLHFLVREQVTECILFVPKNPNRL